MEKHKILQADILDIIFEGKNKNYGAYELRKRYNKTLTRALFITGSFLILVVCGTVLANYNNTHRDRPTPDDIIFVDITPDEALPPPPPPPPPLLPPPPEPNQVIFVPPIIVNDDEVKPEDKIQEITDITAISNQTIVSSNTTPIVQAPVEITNSQAMEIKKPDNENEVFVKVEIEAGFPGGEAAWRNYLERTLNRDILADNGAPGGKYTVMVKFVVSKDGSLSDIKCETDPGFGLCEEAIRVIKNTKKWTPAIQAGRNVNAYRRQPITWAVEE